MTSIQGIYIALYGRPADPAGLAYYTDVTNSGEDLSSIGDLSSVPEYQDQFAEMSSEEIVTSIYESLFERTPDAEGLAFYVSLLEESSANINRIAIDILNGAQNEDLATINAKIEAADLFTMHLDTDAEVAAYQGNDAAAIGRAFIDTVNADDEGTGDEADAFIAQLQGPDEGQGPGEGDDGDEGGETDVTAPVFVSGSAATVNENVDAGTVVYTAQATDNVIVASYALSGTDAADFDINAETGEVVLSAPPNFEAKSVYTFDVLASDPFGNVTTQTVTLTVSDLNEAPVAQDFSATTNEDVAASGSLSASASDPDGDVLTYSLATPVDGLTLNGDGTFTFDTSDAAFQSLQDGEQVEVEATYTVDDGNGLTSSASLTITVTGVNDLPVVENSTGTLIEDGSISGQLTATDADGDALTFVLTSDVENGVLTLNADGSYTYAPDLNFYGTDTFTYTANDETGNSAEATVTLTVTPDPDTYDLTSTQFTGVDAITWFDALSEGMNDVFKIGSGEEDTVPNTDFRARTELAIQVHDDVTGDYADSTFIDLKTNNKTVLELNVDLTGLADLDESDNGGRLMNALGLTAGDMRHFDVQGSWEGYLIAYQDGAAYIYAAHDADGNQALRPGEIDLVAVALNMGVGDMTHNNFA